MISASVCLTPLDWTLSGGGGTSENGNLCIPLDSKKLPYACL